MQRTNPVLAGLVGTCLVVAWPAICRAQFAGHSGEASCHDNSVSALAQQYRGLDAAASALGFTSVKALLEAIDEHCASIDFSGGFANPVNLSLNDGASISATSLLLTDGGAGEARSAFFAIPVKIQSFTNDFSFLLTDGSNPMADGITFTIYTGALPDAVGPAGGGLGYGPDTPGGAGGIPNSVAVKFDLFNDQGEGVDSTGLYQDGQSPTIPAIDMSGSGINLHSGDVFQVHMTYDGTNLTVTITDTITNALFSQVYAVNIPQIVGASTAFVGFTAGTGGLTAIQEILTWKFVPGT
jgi:hypothetical protein